MLTRRRLLQVGGAALATAMLPLRSFAANDLAKAMKESDLIYLTPIKSNGNESKCQAEIWFASDGMDMFVCTGTESWRARAPRQGLNRARVWVGDLGVWTGTNGKYKSLPKLETEVAIIDDKTEQARVLDLMGDKYSLYWLVWGPRFRSGLKDGSRTMLRYRPV